MADGPTWYRLCWTLQSDGRLTDQGTLTGRDVPHMLAGLRDRFPLTPQDPEEVQQAADTPSGWSYESGPLSLHSHRTPAEGSRLPYFTCPARRKSR